MSKGWIVAAAADADAARIIAEGFQLEPLQLVDFTDSETAVLHIAGADNIGVILSNAATRDAAFVAVLQLLGQQRANAQIILAEPEARDAFAFLPRDWPVMALDEARNRAEAAAKRRTDLEQAPHAAPLPPAQEEPPASEPSVEEPAPMMGGASAETEPEVRDEAPADVSDADRAEAPEVERAITFEEDAKEAAPAEEEPFAPPQPAPAPAAEPPPKPQAARQAAATTATASAAAAAMPRGASSAPADATAFAPKKLRRGSPELIRIVIHQSSQLKEVLKAAKKIDPTAAPGPQGMGLGDIELGASIGVSLDVRGASCDGAVQRRTWRGEPIDFNFSAEAEDGAKKAVILARVFIDDAQIGTIAFTRPISGPKKKAADMGDGARMKRFKRVFLSYSAKDRETVSRIATAYQAAGVEHFWDRASLKSGEEWSPRLRKEIDRSDLFHLCWSKSAAASEWVEKEAEHALTRRKRSNGKQPAITVQMLDGPPWAPHPASLDSINFDDFVRAAIVGYARGDG